LAAPRATEGSTKERPTPAVEAVLALVIERPSYSFELWRRFEARFGQLYPVSKARIYQVLDQLLRHGLIEQLPAESTTSRQPRVQYRATAEGARTHRAWIAASIQDDPLREELLRRLLATGARDARGMLQIIEAYERAYLNDMTRKRAGQQDATPRPVDETTELRETLIAEERRLARDAQLKFITFARRHLRAALDSDRA
jgi:DNA-binding PadR family transcriptional regulator